jgi:hypothetical protein
MRKSLKLLVLVGIIGGVILGSLLFWRGGNSRQNLTDAASSDPDTPGTSETNPSASYSRHPAGSTNEESTAMPAASSPSRTNWSDKVDTILAANVPESDKARQFLEMFPGLPEEGQEAVANHLSNLLPNEDYARLAAFFTNAALSPEVLDILMRDALNRPNSLKLPVLLEVARNPQHPKAGEARQTLAFVLQEDEGDDWGKWQARMDEWLQANPD